MYLIASHNHNKGIRIIICKNQKVDEKCKSENTGDLHCESGRLDARARHRKHGVPGLTAELMSACQSGDEAGGHRSKVKHVVMC